ncbi:uncharacterized protein LOC62_01G000057 [Vanrija pseudolonga]|uniref:Uncharacterized protein n=1 Tax=Vanrija pseudolonga TaxID=143232 RepID=A0AAF1BEH6_9TREE|nr:hypothetical protein LOC62_01G000057 [Vanrija pseudolonga]
MPSDSLPSVAVDAVNEATFRSMQRVLASLIGPHTDLGDLDDLEDLTQRAWSITDRALAIEARAAAFEALDTLHTRPERRTRALVNVHAYGDHPPARAGWQQFSTTDRGTDFNPALVRPQLAPYIPPWRTTRRGGTRVHVDYAALLDDMMPFSVRGGSNVRGRGAMGTTREPLPWVYATEAEALRHVHELQDLILWCTNPTGDLSGPTKQFLFDSAIPMILNYIDEVHATLRGDLRRPRSYELSPLDITAPRASADEADENGFVPYFSGGNPGFSFYM